jgi:hypothetical protein
VARQKTTPGDQLAAVDEQIDELVREGEALSARQGDAEGLIRSYPDRREAALTLKKLGEHADVPDEAERARLQRSVADAVEEQGTIRAVRLLRGEERLKIIAAGLPHFDAQAEESARAYGALGEILLAALAAFQGGAQAKGGAWRRSYDGRRELGIDQMPGVSSRDLDHLKREIEDAMRSAWPGESEDKWREFTAREQAPPRARLSNAEALVRFEGRAA